MTSFNKLKSCHAVTYASAESCPRASRVKRVGDNTFLLPEARQKRGNRRKNIALPVSAEQTEHHVALLFLLYNNLPAIFNRYLANNFTFMQIL